VIAANVFFAAAFVVALLGHWQLALIVIGVGLVPAVAAQVVRRRSSRGKGSARDEW
jgi:ABC-type multidrug transport system fused ATPase/permease subunit